MTIRLGLVVILLVFPPLSSGADPLLKLSGGWEYLRGDSPVDDQGRFSWMHDDSSEWKSFDPHESLLEDDHYVWFRVRLPAGEWRDPATLLRIKTVFEAYLDGEFIYRSGELEEAYGNKFELMRWHMVSLPQDFAEKILYLRIYSNTAQQAGFSPDLTHNGLIGARGDIVGELATGELDRLFIFTILVLIGLTGLYVYARRDEPLALSFGLLSFCAGLYTFGGTAMRQLLWDAPVLWWYLYQVSFYLVSAGLWFFYERITYEGGRRAMRHMWQGYALFAVGLVVLDVANLIALPQAKTVYMCLLTVSIVVSIVVFIRSPEKNNPEFKIFHWGIAVLMVTGFHDILRGLHVLTGEFLVFHWGVLIFVLIMGFTLEQRLKTQAKLAREFEAELRIAHELQLGLMPAEPPQIKGFDIAGRCIPASHVGGDFYQYFQQDGKLILCMADVTGHAMEAAVPVIMFSGALHTEMKHGKRLETLFSSLNETLCKSLDQRTFVCFCMGELDIAGSSFRLSDAACPYPFHFRFSKGDVVELQVDAYPLGIRPETAYAVIETTLEPKDYIVFCSDGVIEAGNDREEAFSFERTAETIRQGGAEGLSAEALIDRLIGAVQDFTGDEPQGDDITCVVLRVEA